MLTATITEAQDHVIVHDANVRSSWIACMHAKLYGIHVFSRGSAFRVPEGLWGRRGADEPHSRRNSPCAGRIPTATCPKLPKNLRVQYWLDIATEMP